MPHKREEREVPGDHFVDASSPHVTLDDVTTELCPEESWTTISFWLLQESGSQGAAGIQLEATSEP